MIKDLIIRQENKSDYKKVFKLIEKAFASEKMSDHQEQFLVEKLRKSDNFIPKLSLVAELKSEIVGFILLTPVKIQNSNTEFQTLALAPVAVLPKFQKQGIGGSLIRKSHELARNLNYNSVVLLGHEDYYPKFGYLPASNFQIEFPVQIPEENFMAIELEDNALKEVSGKVVYPPEFNI